MLVRLAILLLLVIPLAAAVCTKDQTQEYLSSGTSYQPKPKQVDYVLMLDRSGSMQGLKIDTVKEAAKALVDLMPQTDRAALVSFNYQASLDQPLTTDHEALYSAIGNLSASFSTKYIPPLLLSQQQFANSTNDKALIILTDGRDDYAEKDAAILNVTESMAKQGVCILTISYSLGGEESPLLTAMADIGQKYGCGQHFAASEKGTELKDVFTRIHETISSTDLLSVKTDVSAYGYNAKVSSNLNGVPVPGSAGSACADTPKFIITFSKDDKTVATYEGASGSYSLPDGDYTYRSSALLDCGGNCDFSGFDEGNLTIGGSCRPGYTQLVSYITGETQTIQITGAGFVPKTVSGGQGTLISWHNQDSVQHRIASPYFDKTLDPGDTFTYIIQNIGTLVYSDPDRNLSGSITSVYGSGTDLLLIIDESGSMVGSGIAEAKLASEKFFSLLTPVDRAALITFSQDAYLLQDFTSDKDLLNAATDSMSAQSTTMYLRALALASSVKPAQKGVIIFMSDGVPTDPEGSKAIVASAQALRKKGWCFMTVGFGDEGVAARDLLAQMAGTDECTAFLYASSGRLAEAFGTVYQLAHNEDDMSFVNLHLPLISFSRTISISTGLLSKTGNPVPGGTQPLCSPAADVQVRTAGSASSLQYVNGAYKGNITLANGFGPVMLVASLAAPDEPGRVFVASTTRTVFVVTPLLIVIAAVAAIVCLLIFLRTRDAP